MYINDKLPCLWHGADYNPDQWLKYPEVLKKDTEFMKKSHCNVMSVGIFAWSKLEPNEGVFDFSWLDERINSLYENGVYTVLATPSGAMPAWMAEKYPEIKRVSEDGIRNRFGDRHNNCYSSPVYREKIRIMNTKLAERYSKHPGVVMWHISNEFNVNDCHCDLCKENFRSWLKNKYKTIENLNDKWWSGFWSHTYNDFSQIDPPGRHGENSSNPLKLDWHRFKNHMCIDYLKHEVSAIRAVDHHTPITTNYMRFWEIDYAKMAKEIDVISWDNYPEWHSMSTEDFVASGTALYHSFFNSVKKDTPFMMMESSPSATNWQSVSKLRRPGMHLLASLQAVAHGSDTVQYFQWRKSRGQSEQFHGAVIGHDNTSNTRVFKDVSDVGAYLESIKPVAGSLTKNEAAIYFDYDSYWSLRIAQAYRNKEYDKGFINVMEKNFGALWSLNVGCDFVFEDDDFDRYKVIIAPMLFMLKDGIKEKIESFVENGGTFVATFCSGIIDQYGLSFFDTECYPLRKLLGIKQEETDSLYDGGTSAVRLTDGGELCGARYCELIYPEGAEVLGVYGNEFYKGMPAITVNSYGKGKAYFIGTDLDTSGYASLYEKWFAPVLSAGIITKSPDGVSITERHSQSDTFVFILNFNNCEKAVELPYKYEMLAGEFKDNLIKPYGVAVLKKKSN